MLSLHAIDPHWIDDSFLDQSDAEHSLAAYVRQAWPIIEPNTPYLHNWHIDCICEHLTACMRGWITRLLITVPPRTGKSRLVSVLFPTWLWGPANRPFERFVFATWDEALASEQSSTRRFIMMSEWYRQRWGDRVCFTRDQNQVLRYTNTARGTMFSTTMGSGSLGHGGDFILVDDPHNTKVVESDVQRQGVLNSFDQDFSRRLNNKQTGVIILIQQRLHHLDLAAHFLDIYKNAVHVNLPAEAESRTIIDIRPRMPDEADENFADASKKIREDGELLWPQREGPIEIQEAKLVLGPLGYSGQYQQRPSPKTGSIFHPDVYRYYKMLPPLRRMVGSWDTAAKTGQQNDYSAYSLWGQGAREFGSQLYLLHVFKQRMALPELKRTVRALFQSGIQLAYINGDPVACNLKEPDAILIEDTSSGTSVIQELGAFDWDEIAQGAGEGDSLFLPITPVKVGGGDKTARANACTPMLESGYAMLPDPAIFHVPWLHSLLDSMRKFPVAEHDDDIDSVTQALNYLRTNDEPGIIGYYRHEAEKLHRKEQVEQGRQQPLTPAEIMRQQEEESETDGSDLIAEYERALHEFDKQFNGG